VFRNAPFQSRTRRPVSTGYIGQFLRSLLLEAQGAIELALEDLKPGVLFGDLAGDDPRARFRLEL
jgi:hypothetical protein